MIYQYIEGTNMTISFAGQVAIVTGAGNGLGAAHMHWNSLNVAPKSW